MTRKVLVEAPLELPRMDLRDFAPASAYRYLWGTDIKVEGDFLDCIVKMIWTRGPS